MARPAVSRTTPAMLDACCAQAAGAAIATAHAVNRQMTESRAQSGGHCGQGRLLQIQPRGVTVLRYSCVNLRTALDSCQASLSDNWVTMAGKSKKVKADGMALLLCLEVGRRPAGAAARPTFVDATGAAGIRFVHDNGASGRYLYPELFGGGVAVLDVDGDRWPDLLFVNGNATGTAGGRRCPTRLVPEQPRRHVHATSPPAAASTRPTSTAWAPPSPTTTTTAATTCS